MRLPLVPVALISCAKGLKLGSAARHFRSAQVVCLSATEATMMKADLLVANNQVASLKAEKKSLVKESKAYQEASESAKVASKAYQEASESAKVATEIAKFAMTELAKSKEFEVQTLIADNDRTILTVAKYEMQFSIRTIVNGLLRLALPNSKKTGGAMYKEFLNKHVLETKELDCSSLSPSAKKLYEDLVNQPQFASMDKAPLSSWVVTFKEQYGTFNNGQHMLAQLDALWTSKGIACGGDTVERMLLQTCVIALLQQHCLKKNIAILPAEFASVAVLSEKLDRVVGHVTGGKFVPVSQTPVPPSPVPPTTPVPPTLPPAASS
jgi:hypothetical protein